jgi:hypothetical protein
MIKEAMQMKIISLFGLCMIVIILAAGVVCAAKSPINLREVKLKPDIIINEFQVYTNNSYTFQITAAITNSVRGTSTGPFEVILEWRAIPRSAPQYSSDPNFLADIPWNYLGSWRVENLINDPSMKSLPSFKISYIHRTPTEQSESERYLYRLTVDATNQVDEANEGNNHKGEPYPPYFPSVPG